MNKNSDMRMCNSNTVRFLYTAIYRCRFSHCSLHAKDHAEPVMHWPKEADASAKSNTYHLLCLPIESGDRKAALIF